jgi:hypothetical protein
VRESVRLARAKPCPRQAPSGLAVEQARQPGGCLFDSSPAHWSLPSALRSSCPPAARPSSNPCPAPLRGSVSKPCLLALATGAVSVCAGQ